MGEKGAPKMTALMYCDLKWLVIFRAGVVLGGLFYLALQNAETALEGVHDGVVDSLPLIDDLVLVHAYYDIRGGIIFTLAETLIYGLLGEPTILTSELFFLEEDLAQEFDVSTGEEIISSININDALAGLRSGSLNKLPETAPFLLTLLRLSDLRRLPEEHLGAGCFARSICRIQLHALQHLLSFNDALLRCAVALFTGEFLLERFDEVRLCAEKHAPDEIGGGDTR